LRCPYCNHDETIEGALFCTNCGKRIDYNKTDNQVENNCENIQKGLSHKNLIVYLSSVLATIVVVIICVIVVSKQMTKNVEKDNIMESAVEASETTDVVDTITTEESSVVSDENDTEEVSEEEEVSEDFELDPMYLVDYMVLARVLYLSTNSFETYEAVLADDNVDGYPELYMTVYGQYNEKTLYCVNSFLDPYILSKQGYSGADDYMYMINSEDYKVYLYDEYWAAAVGGEWYYTFKDNDWNLLGGMNYEMADNELEYTYSWDNKEIDEATLNKNVADLDIREINSDDVIYCAGSMDYNCDCQQAAFYFENHLDNRGLRYYKLVLDIDSDGQDEVVYAVNNYYDDWVDALPPDSNEKNQINNSGMGRNLVFLVDESDGKTYFYPFFSASSITGLDAGADCDLEIFYDVGSEKYEYSEYLEESFIQRISDTNTEMGGYGDEPMDDSESVPPVPEGGYGDEPDELVMED